MMTSAQGQQQDAALLTHASHNDSAPHTILLIHGAGVSATDWDGVASHLPATDYQLLTPSLFTPHSLALARSARKKPATSDWQSAYASLLADLLAARARAGKAHIVGASFGARLALALAAAAPERIRSVFVTGLPSRIAPALPRALAVALMWTATRTTEALGPRVTEAALDGRVRVSAGGWDGAGALATPETVGMLVDLNAMPDGVAPVVVEIASGGEMLRVRIVAGTRRTRWTPVGDTVDTAVASAKAVVGDAGACIDCRAYEAPGMLHPWNNQAPDMFAQCILATISGADLPADEMKEAWRSS